MAGDGLYLAAAGILEKVSQGKGSIRTLCYSSSIQNKKALYGLVLETAKHLHLLRRIVDQSGWLDLANRNRRNLPRSIKRIDPLLAATLLQDFLFSQLKCGAELKSLVEGSKARLRAELVRAQMHFKRCGQADGIVADSEEDQIPRYARINRCLVDEKHTAPLIASLETETGFKFDTDFFLDPHVPDLLVFPPKSDLITCSSYSNHHIILQDKASCFPPLVLNPPRDAHVVDACAAPGNKTSQLCALVGPGGTVFAFERDPRRFETLKSLTSTALPPSSLKSHSLICQQADFLTIDPNDPKYSNVQFVLCDPSCSGSGMPMSLERSLSHNNDDNDGQKLHLRLTQLSRFQIKILKHAAKFPKLSRLVYSTCSIHAQENEQVVQEILRSCPHLRLVENILPSWPRRGLPEYQFSKHVIRASAKEDLMNGFFVALFETTKQKSE